jgi:transcriptional regulator GlxA family with amidase domain
MHIQILLYDGFDELDALGSLQVLQRANQAGAALRIELVRLGSATVTSGQGLQLHVPRLPEPGRPPGLLLLPGAGWLGEAQLSGWAEGERRRIATVVAAHHQAGTVIATVGSAAAFLAAAGLLDGRAATAYRWVRDELRAAGAEWVEAHVVDEGDLVSSRGATAGLDLALWLVERYAGAKTAHAVEWAIEHERRGVVWRR